MKGTKIIGEGLVGVCIAFSINELIVIRELVKEVKASSKEESSQGQLAAIMSKVVGQTLHPNETLKSLIAKNDLFKEENEDTLELVDTLMNKAKEFARAE